MIAFLENACLLTYLDIETTSGARDVGAKFRCHLHPLVMIFSRFLLVEECDKAMRCCQP